MARPQGSDLDFLGSSRALNLPAPASPNEPARLADLNSALEGLAWKDSARVSTQGNISIATPGASIDGIAMAAGDRVLVRLQTTTTENGIYVWNGAATPMTRAYDAQTGNDLEGAALTVEEGTSSGVTFRQTLVNFTIGTGSPSFTTFGTAAPSASTSTAGTVRLATQAETNAGTDATIAVSPADLAGSNYAAKRFAATFGDGSATSYTITHNLGTLDVVTEVYENGGTKRKWDVEVDHTTTNSVTVVFSAGAVPASNAMRIVVLA